MKNKNKTSRKHYNLFTKRDVLKYVLPSGRFDAGHDVVLQALKHDAPLTYTNMEHGLWLSKCNLLDPTFEFAQLYRAKDGGVPAISTGDGSSSITADASCSTLIGCFNKAQCPVGSRGDCTMCDRNQGRASSSTKTYMDASITRLRATGVPQYHVRSLYRNIGFKGMRVFVNDGSDTFADGVPEELQIAEFGRALKNPEGTFVICTRKYDNLLKSICDGRFRHHIEAGLFKNVVIMLSVSTHRENDALTAMWHRMSKNVKLKFQLSLRPLYEDGIKIHSDVLNDPRIPDQAGDSSGIIDWNGRYSKAVAAAFTRRMEEMIADVRKRSGKTIVRDTWGSSMEVTPVDVRGRTVYVEKGVDPAQARKTANKGAFLVMKNGNVKQSKFEPIELLGSTYVPLGRAVAGQFTGPAVQDNAAFIAAQLQAPVGG